MQMKAASGLYLRALQIQQLSCPATTQHSVRTHQWSPRTRRDRPRLLPTSTPCIHTVSIQQGRQHSSTPTQTPTHQQACKRYQRNSPHHPPCDRLLQDTNTSSAQAQALLLPACTHASQLQRIGNACSTGRQHTSLRSQRTCNHHSLRHRTVPNTPAQPASADPAGHQPRRLATTTDMRCASAGTAQHRLALAAAHTAAAATCSFQQHLLRALSVMHNAFICSLLQRQLAALFAQQCMHPLMPSPPCVSTPWRSRRHRYMPCLWLPSSSLLVPHVHS